MSLRKPIAGSGAAALVLAAGLMVAAAPPTAADHHWKAWGSTRAADQTLRAGCHKYRYHYRVDPPTNSWSAEVFLVNRNGRGITSMALDSASDPAAGWRKWTICRPSTVYGKHKMRMKVTYNPEPEDPTADNIDGWVKPSYFRLKRP
jgi:hypothetical protein